MFLHFGVPYVGQRLIIRGLADSFTTLPGRSHWPWMKSRRLCALHDRSQAKNETKSLQLAYRLLRAAPLSPVNLTVCAGPSILQLNLIVGVGKILSKN